MCNAYQHPPGCRCGWGGDGHLGRSLGSFATSKLGCLSWPDRYLDICHPTTCPKCGASVFFVRHNGGSVWFDELGHPWPKHACFDEKWDEGRYGFELRRMLTSPDQFFGIIIEAERTHPGELVRVTVRRNDDSIINVELNTSKDLWSLLGSLVVVVRDGKDETSIEFVDPLKHSSSMTNEERGKWLSNAIFSDIDKVIDKVLGREPKKFKYWRIIENENSRVVKEFEFWRQEEAEKLEADLQAEYPGKYRLEKHIRPKY